jgi:hypothetical protein
MNYALPFVLLWHFRRQEIIYSIKIEEEEEEEGEEEEDEREGRCSRQRVIDTANTLWRQVCSLDSRPELAFVLADPTTVQNVCYFALECHYFVEVFHSVQIYHWTD